MCVHVFPVVAPQSVVLTGFSQHWSPVQAVHRHIINTLPPEPCFHLPGGHDLFPFHYFIKQFFLHHCSAHFFRNHERMELEKTSGSFSPNPSLYRVGRAERAWSHMAPSSWWGWSQNPGPQPPRPCSLLHPVGVFSLSCHCHRS